MSKVRRIEFLGSWFWLLLWVIFFFPAALLYFALKSVVVEEELDADQFLEWYRSRK